MTHYPHLIPPLNFARQLQAAKRRPCQALAKAPTDSPQIVGRVTRKGEDILVALSVDGFAPLGDKYFPENRTGRVFISLDELPTFYIYNFKNDGSPNLFLLHGVSKNHHRVIVGLQS